MALLAGRLGTVPLAAQSVIMTTDQVLNTIPFGIGVAASARVGNMLGARRAGAASRSAHTAAKLSFVLGTVVLIVLMAVRNVYAKIFSDDEEVISLTATVMPYVAAFQIADGLNGSCGGVMRGMGRQHTAAAVNLVCYYLGEYYSITNLNSQVLTICSSWTAHWILAGFLQGYGPRGALDWKLHFLVRCRWARVSACVVYKLGYTSGEGI